MQVRLTLQLLDRVMKPLHLATMDRLPVTMLPRRDMMLLRPDTMLRLKRLLLVMAKPSRRLELQLIQRRCLAHPQLGMACRAVLRLRARLLLRQGTKANLPDSLQPYSVLV